MSHQVIDRRSVILGPDGQPAFNAAHMRGINDIPAHMRGYPDLTPNASYGSFQSAQYSTDRGYVYLPTLDTKQEVDTWSRLELIKRSRVVYNSGGGIGHKFINGTARMVVGTGIWPHPMSEDKAWNKKRRELFMARAGNANTFDLSKKFNWASGLRAIYRCKKRDGDMVTVFARNQDDRLRVRFYEAHQIANGTTNGLSGSADGWVDGIKLDQHDALTAVRIISVDNGGKETSIDIPSQNVCYCGDYERIGQVRCLPMFYPVLNKVFDRGEIQHALTKGIKTAAQVAYVIEQQMQQGAQVIPGAPNTINNTPPRPTKMVQGPDGKLVSLEQFLTGGEAWGLAAGQSFKIVQSNNPHENVSDYLKEMVRDIANTSDWPYHVVWDIVDLGGANTRFVMVDCQSKIEEEQDALLDQFGTPYYHAQTRDLIEAGELWDVPDWDAAGWIFPKRLTVDFGRDGRLYLEQYKRGMVTMKSLHGFNGDEWQPEVDQFLDERQYIIQGIIDRKIRREDGTETSMTEAEAFPEIQKVAAAAQPDPLAEDPAADPADVGPQKKKAA